jgi:hypothetical protein
MPVCHSCGETVNDASDICPHCFGTVTAPAAPPEVVAETYDLDEEDDEFTLAPAEVEARDVSDTLPDAATGTTEARNLDATAEAQGRCPNCDEEKGAALDLCTACGYHYGLQRILTAEDQDELDLGLRRMIRRALTDDTDLTHVSILAHVTILIIGGVFYVQMPVMRWVLVPLLVGYIVFRIVDGSAGGRFRRSLSDSIWYGFFKLIRFFGRDPRRPSRKLQMLVASDASYSDQDLRATEATLIDYDAVDLEGSSITDSGVIALFAKPRIRYINLRNTKVTESAIRRLQRNHIDAWIWS